MVRSFQAPGQPSLGRWTWAGTYGDGRGAEAAKVPESPGTVRESLNLTERMVIFPPKCVMMFRPLDAGTGSEIDELACVQACCSGDGRGGRAYRGDCHAGQRGHDRRVAALGLRVIGHRRHDQRRRDQPDGRLGGGQYPARADPGQQPVRAALERGQVERGGDPRRQRFLLGAGGGLVREQRVGARDRCQRLVEPEAVPLRRRALAHDVGARGQPRQSS